MAEVKALKNDHVEIKVHKSSDLGNGSILSNCAVIFSACPDTSDIVHVLKLKSGKGDRAIEHTIELPQDGNEYAYTYLSHALRNYDWSTKLHKYGQTVQLMIEHNEDVELEHSYHIATKASDAKENQFQESETQNGGPGYAPDGWEYSEPTKAITIDHPNIARSGYFSYAAKSVIEDGGFRCGQVDVKAGQIIKGYIYIGSDNRGITVLNSNNAILYAPDTTSKVSYVEYTATQDCKVWICFRRSDGESQYVFII